MLVETRLRFGHIETRHINTVVTRVDQMNDSQMARGRGQMNDSRITRE